MTGCLIVIKVIKDIKVIKVIKGDQGDQGAQGDQGYQGDQGDQGRDQDDVKCVKSEFTVSSPPLFFGSPSNPFDAWKKGSNVGKYFWKVSF